MQDKITFTADTGNKTITIAPNVRIKPGKNSFSAEIIEQFKIYELPFVNMLDNFTPAGSQEVVGSTIAVAPVTHADDSKKDLEDAATDLESDNEEITEDLKKAGASVAAKQRKQSWTVGKVIAMDIKRAKVAVAEQDDVKKLVELWQGSRSKPELEAVVRNRILELDPDNKQIKRQAADKN